MPEEDDDEGLFVVEPVKMTIGMTVKRKVNKKKSYPVKGLIHYSPSLFSRNLKNSIVKLKTSVIKFDTMIG